VTGGAIPAEFEAWVESSFQRALGELSWSEIARSLAALTQDYVQRRSRLGARAALAGRGKRAAFALYYAPRHYLVVHGVLQQLGAGACPLPQIVDLGCGSGVAGAAWSALHAPRPAVLGVDPAAWSLAEAKITCRALQVPLRTVHATAARLRWPRPPLGVVAAWMVNELDAAARSGLLASLRRGAAAGNALLIVEPLATRIAPWWEEWAVQWAALGGRADEWHLDSPLPERVAELGRSAGLDPRQLGARTLWLAPRANGAVQAPAAASKASKASR
jgi:hypothetical protein